MDTTDFLLIERVKHKDAAAFSVLFDRYNIPLLKKIHYRINDLSHAEDLLQTMWLRAWEEPDFLKTDKKGSAAAYLHSYANYQVLNFFRTTTPELQTIDEDALEISDSEYFDMLKNGTINEILNRIEHVVKELPATDRKIFDLRIKKNLSVNDTANALHIKEKTVRNRLSTVLGTVRNKLEGEFEFSKNTAFLIACVQVFG